jgi:hypothetical protein
MMDADGRLDVTSTVVRGNECEEFALKRDE